MKKKRPDKDSTRSLADRLTKLTAIVTALCGLLVVVGTHYNDLLRLCRESGLGLCSPPPCVEITDFDFPDTVEHGSWEGQHGVIKGRTNCTEPLGLYVAFVPRQTNAPFANLVPPGGNSRECSGHPARLRPDCWDWKKPIPGEEAEWVWNILLPSLEHLRAPREVEQLHLRWEIRDYDSPNSEAIAGDTATIKIINRITDTRGLGVVPVLSITESRGGAPAAGADPLDGEYAGRASFVALALTSPLPTFPGTRPPLRPSDR
jgi:hypothetical protein